MKRRNGLRFVSRAASTRPRLPHTFPLPKPRQSVALQTIRDNEHGLNVAKLLECDALRRFHVFPKAFSQMMRKDAIRRFFDFI